MSATIKPFVIVPGFGAPHVPHKTELAIKNLNLIRREFPGCIARVCVYSEQVELPAALAGQAEIIQEAGIIGHFLQKYANPEEVATLGCTHVFILLDDVELAADMPLRFMLESLDEHDAQIASPSVSGSQGSGAWDYMIHRPDLQQGYATRSNVCELFFYMMGLDSYRRYFVGLDVRNPWCWGVDMTLGTVRQLQSLIYNDAVLTHWYKGSGRQSALDNAKAYFKYRGLTLEQVLAMREHQTVSLVQVMEKRDSGDKKAMNGKTTSLDLGSGPQPRNPFNAEIIYGLDLEDYGTQVRRCDLGYEPIPFDDSSLDYITAFDFLEHLPRHGGTEGRRNPFLFVMSEIHRCLKPSGVFYARTPAYPNPTAFSDPTHVNFITSDTARYFGTEILGDGARLVDDRYTLCQRYGFNGHFLIQRNVYEAAYGHMVWMFRKEPFNGKA